MLAVVQDEVDFFIDNSPLFNSEELSAIDSLWSKKTQEVWFSNDRSYTSCYIDNANKYTNRLLSWFIDLSNIKLKTTNLNLILHRFYPDDYFHLHTDNVYRNNRYRQYAVGFNLNTDYTGGDYLIRDNKTTHSISKPGVPYFFKSTVPHEITKVQSGLRKSALIFINSDDLETNPNKLL